MTHRAFVLALASMLLPAAAHAEGVAIDHRTIGCVIAGKYPRLSACFAPVSQLARARVYFRVADGPPAWYYVEMKSDVPCFAGVLPKPKKQLVGHKLQYYLNALDRGFAEARTDEAEALVVARAADCDSKLPVAPLLNSAAVTVFPGMPAGFTGAAGLGLGATAAIVGGGAAVVGGGVAVAANHSGSSTNAVAGGPTTTLPPATLPPTTTTTTTTTTTLVGFNPVFRVFKGGIAVDTPITGADPMPLDFDMCASTGPYKLVFDVEVDGVKLANTCHSTITFTGAGAAASSAGTPVRATVTTRSFDVRMHIRSQADNFDPQAGKRLTVQVGSNSCATDTAGPSVRLTLPSPRSSYPSPAPYPVHMEAVADDSGTGNNGVAFVEYKINNAAPDQLILGPVSAAPYAFDWSQAQVEQWLASNLLCANTASIQAYAVDNCGNATLSQPVPISVSSSSSGCLGLRARSGEATATWVSDLSIAGGSGQVVVNGEAAFPRAGRSAIAVRLRPGENRVEATLIEGRSSGTWRFELGGVAGLRPESVRVVAGELMQAGGDALVFRLRGRPGERIVFSFVIGE